MATSYLALRQLHFRHELVERWRGLDRIVLVGAGLLSWGIVYAVLGLILALSHALLTLTEAGTPTDMRWLTVIGWQGLTFSILWLARPILFMRTIDAFVASLPVSARSIWLADILMALQCYSLLWLPLLCLPYMIWRQLPPLQAFLACMAFAIMVAVGLLFNLLLLRKAMTSATAMLLPLLVMVFFQPQSFIGFTALIGTGLLTTFAAFRLLRRSSEKRAQPPAPAPPLSGFHQATALVLPIAWHVLHDTLIWRSGMLLASLGLSLALPSLRPTDPRLPEAAMIMCAALISVMLYGMPALISRAVLTRLDFLAGHRGFRRRVILCSTMLASLIFCTMLSACWLISSHLMAAGAPHPKAILYPVIMFFALFIAGVWMALKISISLRWIMPTAHLTLMLILLMAAFS